jgi:hypothetical protein
VDFDWFGLGCTFTEVLRSLPPTRVFSDARLHQQKTAGWMFNEDLPLEVRKALFDNKLAMAQKNADVAVAEKAVAIHKYDILTLETTIRDNNNLATVKPLVRARGINVNQCEEDGGWYVPSHTEEFVQFVQKTGGLRCSLPLT